MNNIMETVNLNNCVATVSVSRTLLQVRINGLFLFVYLIKCTIFRPIWYVSNLIQLALEMCVGCKKFVV